MGKVCHLLEETFGEIQENNTVQIREMGPRDNISWGPDNECFWGFIHIWYLQRNLNIQWG